MDQRLKCDDLIPARLESRDYAQRIIVPSAFLSPDAAVGTDRSRPATFARGRPEFDLRFAL